MKVETLKVIAMSAEVNNNLLSLILEAYRPIMLENTITAIERALKNNKEVIEVINIDIELKRLDKLF